MSPGQTDLPPNHGAAYVRMSAEHQQHSNNQMAVIREYAKRHEMQIVKEYSDVNQSGVNDQGREF